MVCSKSQIAIFKRPRAIKNRLKILDFNTSSERPVSENQKINVIGPTKQNGGRSKMLYLTLCVGPLCVWLHFSLQIVSAGGDAYTGRLPARPRTPVLIEAQKHVRARLERKWLAEFMKTLDFLSRNKGGVARSVNGRRISKSSGKDMTSSVSLSTLSAYSFP